MAWTIIGLCLACGVGGAAVLAVVWTRGEGLNLTTDELPGFALMVAFGPFCLFAASLMAIGYGVTALWRKVMPSQVVLIRGRK